MPADDRISFNTDHLTPAREAWAEMLRRARWLEHAAWYEADPQARDQYLDAASTLRRSAKFLETSDIDWVPEF